MSQGKPLYSKKGKVVYPVILPFFPLIERRCLTKNSPASLLTSIRFAALSHVHIHHVSFTLVRFLMRISMVFCGSFLINFLPSSDFQKQKKPASLQAFFHV